MAGLGLVCQDCRRTRHGTKTRYKTDGCRCDLCRAWNNQDQRKYVESYRSRNGESAKARFRNPAKRSPVSRAVRLAIYERDEWTCQLCAEPVDPNLPVNDRMSPTLDHIECQSWSLIPDHSERNLRLAHRACNASRGNVRAA